MEESTRELRRAYGESLNHLDDLRRLGGPELAPLAGQIQYHLANMLEAAEKDVPVPLQHPYLNSLAKNAVSEALYAAFEVGRGVQSITQFFHPHTTFMAWERLLANLPAVIKVAHYFEPRAVNLVLENDGFVLEVIASDQAKLAQYRQQAYRLTQEFWSQKALLTYEITERNGQAWVSLRVRYAACSSSELEFVVNNLKFDPVFSLYQTTALQTRAIGEHHVVCLDNEGQVSLHARVPEQDSNEKTFIHLPFLFRPLSLIISGRGELTTSHAEHQRVELFDLFR